MRALTFAAMIPFGLALGTVLTPCQAADTPDASQLIQSLTPPQVIPMATRGIGLGTHSPSGQSAPDASAKSPEANLSIPFASGSTAISPAAARILDQLGAALASPQLADFKFRVEGHTDTVGVPETNKILSQRRAASVTDYLATKYGIDHTRLTPTGMGQEGLLIETGPGVPEPRNRRVVVVNLGH
jgi:OOP family OmpA-OmpF porin